MKTMFDFIKRWVYNPPCTTKKLTLKMRDQNMYTEQMTAKIMASAPLNLDKAHALASEFGTVTYRSVISKAKSLGVEYIKKAPAAKTVKDTGPTKAALLLEIRKTLELSDREGDLTKIELQTILTALVA